MAKPWIHAKSSARKFGGQPEDYLAIHQKLDSSKSVFPDNRHRALTHNSWFLFILEDIFGVTIENSDGKRVSVREVGEQHILEDFGNTFIPSAQDYLENLEYREWMTNGRNCVPPSHARINERKRIRKIDYD